ncbi:MAG: hypothetical protein H7A32_04955 [Deltaproteobacteria bacterium]|nr:hypothetical protein [Deltaproteobacteria bacterium]
MLKSLLRFFFLLFKSIASTCRLYVQSTLSLKNKHFKTKFILLTSLFALSCGASLDSTPQEPPLAGNHLPLKLIKFLPSDQITGELHIYNSADEEIYSTPLEVNSATGQVQSPIFEIPKNNRYTYLSTFYVGEIPFAAVYMIVDILEEAVHVEFSPEQVMTRLSDLDPNYEGHISLGRLPNFDLDGDGYTNYEELVEGSNPQDESSLPEPPEVSGEIANNQENIIKIELTFTDASEIIRVAPKNPVCGYHQWELIPQPESDGRIQKLVAEFNTRAYAGNDQITLVIEATDSLGMSAEYTFDVTFSKVDPVPAGYEGPEIAVTRPERGATVSGFVPVKAIACHETGIESLVSLDANDGDSDNLAELFQANVDTEVLTDGETDLRFKAIDNQGKSREYYHPVVVANAGEIKIQSPAPGSEVRDQIQVSAYVDTELMPDLTSFTITQVIGSQGGDEFKEIVKDLDSNTDKFSSVQDLSFEKHERSVTLVFEAKTPNKTVTRHVTYFINNDPDIRLALKNDHLGNAPCLEKGSAVLEWEVTNRNLDDAIYLFSSQTGTNFGSAGEITNLTDENGYGSKIIECDDAHYWRIEAKRTADFKATRDLALQKVTLSGDLGEPSPNLVRIQPGEHDWLLEGVLEEQPWSVEVTRNNELIDEPSGMGALVSVGNLAPRGYYEFKLKLLNEESELVSVRDEYLTYLTQDKDLVLWYPLNEEGGYGTETVYGDRTYELSGASSLSSFSAYFYGTPVWTQEAYNGLYFDSLADYAVANLDNDKKLHASPSGLSLELLLKVSSVPQNAEYIFSKNGEFALGIVKDGDQYKFKGTLGLTDQSCANNGFEQAGNWKYIETENTSYDINSWHHVVMTYSLSEKNYKVYVDGIIEQELSPLNFPLNNTCSYKHALNALVKKDDTVTKKGLFRGILSEVAVYKRALSQVEIKASCQRLAAELCQ